MKKNVNKLNTFQHFCLCVCISMQTSYSLFTQIFLFYFTHSIVYHKIILLLRTLQQQDLSNKLVNDHVLHFLRFFFHWHLQQLWKNQSLWFDTRGVCIIACCLCDIQEVCFFACWLTPYFCLTKPAQILLFISCKNFSLSLNLPSQNFYLSSFHSLEKVSLLTHTYSSGHGLCDTCLQRLFLTPDVKQLPLP